MIRNAQRPVTEILGSLNKNDLVIDIGGAVSPWPRADAMLDILNFADIKWDRAKSKEPARLKKENYYQIDICARNPWPIKDKSFDYAVCSHTLEDIRDPIWVCSEMIRIAKAGYIEVPSRIYETTFNLEARNFAGADHHHWIIDLHEGKLRFVFKHMYVHHRGVNKNRRTFTKQNKHDADLFLRLEWSDTFVASEHFLLNGKEVFEYFAGRPISYKEFLRIRRTVSPRSFVARWLAYFSHRVPVLERLKKNFFKDKS